MFNRMVLANKDKLTAKVNFIMVNIFLHLKSDFTLYKSEQT